MWVALLQEGELSSTSNTYLFLSWCLRASFVKRVDGAYVNVISV